jgi:putative ABC transport system substrate-binding protein
VAVLVNPANAVSTETTLREVGAAARAIGLQIQVLNANTIREIDAAFATLASERPDALFVSNDPFLINRRLQLSMLAVLHKIPAIYQDRLNAEAGGLISYGANIADAYRHVGVYTGRILKGAKPADLPVVQSSKFELIINASTARMLGLTMPDKLLVAADEVIE